MLLQPHRLLGCAQLSVLLLVCWRGLDRQQCVLGVAGVCGRQLGMYTSLVVVVVVVLLLLLSAPG